MFQNRSAFAMIPAKDMERARSWYAEKLGISTSGDSEFGLDMQLNGVRVFLYASAYAGTAEHTLLSFECDDLLADMAALRAKGVTFIDYDLPGFKTEGGVAEMGPMRNAWAKDSEGNILAFVEGM